MPNQRKVIVISGTPGTGKTTVAKILKEELSALYINLTEIAIEKNYILEDDELRQTKVINPEKLTAFLENFINSHMKTIIIEGHYADIVPDSLISIFIILRTAPDVLEKRLRKKQFNISKIQENLQSEILGSCTAAALEVIDPKKIYEVDSSTATPQIVTEQILNLIETNPTSNVGKINWMHDLEEKGELIKYFK